ncbi:MAG: Rpn family recombination-promoting nuclease/putative transposase [Thiotrichales bacterium]
MTAIPPSAHDEGYKQLFSHAELVGDVLRGFVHEPWVEQLDFTSLEKVNGSYVTDDLREREDDVIWRVRLNNTWLYVYLLIEFQSSNDPWMALRIMVYTGLLYQDLIKSGVVSAPGKLPAVFPIVIYNGSGRWSAARELAELIEPLPPSMSTYRPNQRYFVLDEGRLEIEQLNQADNTFSEIIHIEASAGPEAVREVVARLKERLKDPRHASLRRAIVVWVRRVIFKRLAMSETISEITDLMELEAMLAENVTSWAEKWKQEGLQQGLQEGLQEGRQEGRQEGLQKLRALVGRQLSHRFGTLPQGVAERLAQADFPQLENWADKVLDAATLEAVFTE